MSCEKEDMWKRVCDALNSVAPNVLEELPSKCSKIHLV